MATLFTAGAILALMAQVMLGMPTALAEVSEIKIARQFGKGNEFKFDNLSASMATPDATAALSSGGGEINNLPGR